MNQKVGFIGQGWVGKHYADEFEQRGYGVIRYSLDSEYSLNKEAISLCDVVFIAVPTPTTTTGFDDSIVRETLRLVREGATAVIKSTLLPGTTAKLQTAFPKIFVFHSPEFLVEATAAYDAANPQRNIIGVATLTSATRAVAETVLSLLPPAPYAKIMSAEEAELVKYVGNCFLYMKVLCMNIFYDFAEAKGLDWSQVHEAVIHDTRIGVTHTNPIHSSGRGAGGHCFIKDFEAFRQAFKETVGNTTADAVLSANTEFNIDLLHKSGKDIDLLQSVYGPHWRLISEHDETKLC